MVELNDGIRGKRKKKERCMIQILKKSKKEKRKKELNKKKRKKIKKEIYQMQRKQTNCNDSKEIYSEIGSNYSLSVDKNHLE